MHGGCRLLPLNAIALFLRGRVSAGSQIAPLTRIVRWRTLEKEKPMDGLIRKVKVAALVKNKCDKILSGIYMHQHASDDQKRWEHIAVDSVCQCSYEIREALKEMEPENASVTREWIPFYSCGCLPEHADTETQSYLLGYFCSECGRRSYEKSSFCHNCGTDMRSGRKTGKWEYHSNPSIGGGMNPEDAYCSVCGFHVNTTEADDFDNYNFCPDCGADMRHKND